MELEKQENNVIDFRLRDYQIRDSYDFNLFQYKQFLDKQLQYESDAIKVLTTILYYEGFNAERFQAQKINLQKEFIYCSGYIHDMLKGKQKLDLHFPIECMWRTDEEIIEIYSQFLQSLLEE